MESSSEDDFAWTSASCSESDKEMKMAHDEESESGKSFKRKLQKELFQNGFEEEAGSETPRKKKKMKRERVTPARDASVKRESGARCNGAAEGEGEGEAEAELMLQRRVKEERRMLAPHERAGDSADGAPKKKKRKHKTSEVGPNDKSEAEGTFVVEPGPSAENGTPRKKTKRKREKQSERDESANEPPIDKFEAEETVVEPRRPEPEVDGHASAARDGGPDEPYTSKEFVDDDSGSRDERPPSPARGELDRRPLRISERITFEEDSDSRPEPEPAREPAREPAGAGRLGRYLRARPQLRPAPGGWARAASLAADDEVWLVRAPRQLPAAALLGVALRPDERTKLKLAGRAYEALPAPCAERVALLARSSDGGGAGLVARGVRVRGALQLRARPPRVRAPPDRRSPSPAPPPPPPPARARHPLLGAGHELAARLAPAVRRRLDEARGTPEVDGERREKKKKKKKHKERADPEPQEEPERRPRKRKRGSARDPDADPDPDPDPAPAKKHKKSKRRDDDATGAALWDSERAIEESLFNY